MSVTDHVYTPMFVAAELRQAIIDLVKEWIDTYLQIGEGVLGRPLGTFPRPRTYSSRVNLRRLPQENLPQVIITCPGTSATAMDGDGIYRATWVIGAGAIVSAAEEAGTQLLADAYGAALRALLLHQTPANFAVMGVNWTGDSYDDLTNPDENRTVKGSVAMFQYEIYGIVNRRSGPTGPFAPAPPITPTDSDPDPTWPTAETYNITVNKEAL